MSHRIVNDLDTFSVSESTSCDVENCIQHISAYPNALTILTQNIRSIHKNINNFSTFLQRLNFDCDVIILTECWLSSHNCNLPCMEGYTAYYTKTCHNQNDGVVVYARNYLNISVEELIVRDCSCLLVKVETTIAILAVYRPHLSVDTFLESMHSHLQRLSFKNIALVGDININILPGCCDGPAQEYLNRCSFNGLLPAHTLPTFQSGSCLDHVMLKSSLPAITLVTNSSVTDHKAVLLILSREEPKLKNETCTFKLNHNNLEDDLCNIDLISTYDSASAESYMSYLISEIQQIIRKHTVKVKISRKNLNIKPWITPGLIRCMRNRDKLHMKAKSCPNNPILQLTYKRYRNFCNSLLKNIKIKYDKNLLEGAGHNTKKIWKIIKNVTYTAKQRESSSSLLKSHASPEVAANSCNEFFTNIGKTLAEQIQNQLFAPTIEITQPQLQSFVFLDIDCTEVERIIMGLKDDCATGWDNIPTKILKKYKHILARPLTLAFQKCLQEGVFPTCLKKAVVVPIHKSGSKENITNYRPISLLSSISKIFEKIINNRLVNYLENKALLSKNQFGFRPKLSTADAVHELTDFVTHELDKGNKTIGIFLDLAKAFDTVPTPILLKKLENIGVRDNQLKLLTSYLSDRCQYVRIDSVVSSDLKNASFGIPQGSILGPTLFLIYINDLCNLQLANGKIISYADDTALLFSAGNDSQLYELAQHGFNIVNSWLRGHLLTLNAEKTKYLKFTMRKQRSAIFTNPLIYAHACNYLKCDNVCQCPNISFTNHIKYLGVIIDETLSFNQHIEVMSNRLRKLIYVFKKLRYIADTNSVKQIYLALCQSIITYCITSWGGACKTFILAAERAQRAILKVSTFRPFLYPTNLLYKSCKVLTVRQLFILYTVLKQHRALSYSTEVTNKRRKDIVCTNTATNKHAFATRFFMFLGPYLYNKLNRNLYIYEMNLINCKKTILSALANMTYEETEELLIVPM